MLDFSSATWNFPVDTAPVYDVHGNKIDGYLSVVDTSRERTLAVHSDSYSLVPHSDVVEAIDAAVRSMNISSDMDVKIIDVDSGKKLRGQILFNDLVVEPDVGDYVAFSVNFFNSYDGSWSFGIEGQGHRLWCKNGCTTADTAARSRFKHTKNISVDAAVGQIARSLEIFHTMPEIWRDWMRTSVRPDDASLFFERTVAKAPSTYLNDSKVNAKQHEALMRLFDSNASHLGANKWALYNTLTEWASHPHESKSPEITRRNREGQIASAMASAAWHRLG